MSCIDKYKLVPKDTTTFQNLINNGKTELEAISLLESKVIEEYDKLNTLIVRNNGEALPSIIPVPVTTKEEKVVKQQEEAAKDLFEVQPETIQKTPKKDININKIEEDVSNELNDIFNEFLAEDTNDSSLGNVESDVPLDMQDKIISTLTKLTEGLIRKGIVDPKKITKQLQAQLANSPLKDILDQIPTTIYDKAYQNGIALVKQQENQLINDITKSRQDNQDVEVTESPDTEYKDTSENNTGLNITNGNKDLMKAVTSFVKENAELNYNYNKVFRIANDFMSSLKNTKLPEGTTLDTLTNYLTKLTESALNKMVAQPNDEKVATAAINELIAKLDNGYNKFGYPDSATAYLNNGLDYPIGTTSIKVEGSTKPNLIKNARLKTILTQRFKTSQSILGIIPNFISVMGSKTIENIPVLRGLGITEATRASFNRVPAEFAKAFTKAFEENVNTPFNYIKKGTAKDKAIIKNLFQNPLLAFNSDPGIKGTTRIDGTPFGGITPENLTTTMALVAFNWLGTRASNNAVNSPSVINNILGRPADTPVDDNTLRLLGNIGMPKSQLENELGMEVLNQLNLKFTKGVDGAIQQNLVNAIGMSVLNTLVHQKGLIDISKIKKSEIDAEYATNIDTPDIYLNFVKVKYNFIESENPEESFFAPAPKIKRIKDYMAGEHREGINVFESLFNLKEVDELPADTPTDKVDIRLKRTINEMDSAHKKAAKAQQQFYWTPKVGILSIFRMMPTKGFNVNVAKLFGYNDDVNNTVMKSDREAVTAKNLQIASSIDAIKTFIKTRGEKGKFYDVLEAYRTTRMGYKNTQLDIQQDKVVRHFFRGEHFLKKLPLTGKISIDHFKQTNAAKYAILEGMGYKAEELFLTHDDNTKTIAGKFNDLLLTLDSKSANYNPILGKAYKAISKNIDEATGNYKDKPEVFTSSEQQSVYDAIDEIGEGEVSIDAFDSLIRWKYAIDNNRDSIDMDIGIEVDGKTNGYAITLTQWGKSLDEDTRSALNRSGLYFDGDTYQSYREYRASPNSLDNYQFNAELSIPHFRKRVEEILQPQFSRNGKLITKKPLVSVFMPFKAESAGTANEKLLHNFKTVPHEKYVTEAEKYLAIDNDEAKVNTTYYKNYILPMLDRIDAIKLIIPNFDDVLTKGVSSRLRKLMKDPHMKGNYGQGQLSIERDIADKLFQEFKDHLASLHKKPEAEMVAELEKLSNLIAPKGINILNQMRLGTDTKSILDINLTAPVQFLYKTNVNRTQNDSGQDVTEYTDVNISIQQALNEMFKETVGITVGNTMDQLLHESTLYREQIVAAVKVMSIMEAVAYKKEVALWKKDNPKYKSNILNRKQHNEILQRLQDKGLQVSIPTPNAKNYKQYMPLTEHDTAPVNAKGFYNGSVNMRNKMPITELETDYETGEIVPKEDASVQETTRGIVSNEITPIQSIGSPVFMIFGTDSTIQSNIMNIGKHVGNVHDAHWTDIESIYDVSPASNQAMIDTVSQYRFMEVIADRYQNYLDQYKAGFKADQGDAEAFQTLMNRYYEKGIIDNITDFSETQDLLAKTLPELKENSDTLIGEINANLAAVDQYVNPFTKVSMGDSTLDITQLADEVVSKDNLGSTDSNVTLENNMEAIIATDSLGGDTAQTIFDSLDNTVGKPENATHTNHLTDILHNLVIPALKASERTFEVVRGSLKKNYDDGKNKGEFNPETNTVYLAATGGIAASNQGMSQQEVAIHEWIHAVTLSALLDPSNYHIKRQLQRLFNDVKNGLENKYKDKAYEIFIPKDANGNNIFYSNEAEERRAAQNTYNYIFNNKKGYHLEEFISYGLSNQALINEMKSLPIKQARDTSTGTWIDRLANLFLNMVDWIVNATGKNNANSDKYLQQLVTNLVDIKKARNRQLNNAYKIQSKINSAASDMLVNKIISPWINYNVDRAQQKSGKIRNLVDLAIATPMFFTVPKYKAWMDDTAYKLKLTKDNFIYKLIHTEILPTAEQNKVWDDMLRNSKHTLDKARNEVAIATSNSILENFDPNDLPNNEELKALTVGYLKTDVDALMDTYSIDNIQKLYTNYNYRMKEIEQLKDELDSLSKGKESNYWKTQAESLGYMMVTGSTGMRGQSLNAHNIAGLTALRSEYKDSEGKSKVLAIPRPVNADRAEAVLEKLISIHAINSLPSEIKTIAAKRMKSEYTRNKVHNGVSMILGIHRKVKQDSLEKLFNNNKTLIRKGYTKEQYDPNISFKVGNKSDNFSDQGYVLVTEKDPLPTDAYAGEALKNQYLWINTNALVNSTITGILSKTNTVHSGTNIIQLAANKGIDVTTKAAHRKAHKAANTMHRKVLNDLQKAYNGTLKLDYTQNYMVPTTDLTGAMQGYRYMMTEATKNSLLNKQDKVNKVLGNMAGNIVDKLATQKNNLEVVYQAKAEYDAYGTVNKRDFTYIGKNAKDPENIERWAMLPVNTRRAITKTWGMDGFYVRTELLDRVFGYRKLSLGDVPALRKARIPIKIMENILQDIVKRAKSKIVILTPEVLYGNVVSNTVYLALQGVPIRDIVKDTNIALRALNDHRITQEKKDKLQLQYDVTKTNMTSAQAKSMKDEIIKLDKEIKTNPVNKLIDAGIFQSIVEDVDLNDSSYITSKLETNKFTKNLFKKYEENDSILKEIYEQAAITSNTDSYKALLKATQYSDFTARYVLHEFNKKRGISERDSLRDINEAFIFYDLPTSKQLQYANDMGWFMYSKYWLRRLRRIFKLFQTNPANAVAYKAMEDALNTDVEDIMDNLPTPSAIYNKVDLNPINQVDDAIDISSWNYIEPVLPF